MDTIRDQLRAALAVAPDAMLVIDKSGTIIDANDLATELVGYSVAELIGQPMSLLVPHRLHQDYRRERDAFWIKPVRRKPATETHVLIRTKSGREFPSDFLVGPAGGGDELLALVSMRDMSAHAKREQELRATIEETERRLRVSVQDFRQINEHFKLFLKHAPADIALLDRQMRYLIVSDRLLKDYRLNEQDIHGMGMYDVFPDMPERWKEMHRRCLAGETLKSDEDVYERSDGRTEWLKWEMYPWRTADGRVAGIFMVSELITARKNAELALRKSHQQLELRVAERTAQLEAMKNDADRANSQKSWFVAAASHDLRQPLQASLAYLSVLARRAGREDLEELCDKARQPLKAMSDILDVLLDISDLESGHVKPQRRDFLLNELLERVIANVQHQAQDKGLRLSYLPTDFTVHSDPRLLERVISNFVTNAIRYTAKGLIGIYCEAVGDTVCISVTDTGIGIPSDAIGTIFEDHVQLGNPARDRRKGLGLGLSIAKRIADALGHRISVQSELGTGSSFSIELPQSSAAVAATEAPKPESTALKDQRPVVLLIDDDRDVAEAMQMLLQSYSFETYMASSRDAALAMLDSGLNPGLVLCDYRMPGANGVEVIRQVRRVLNTDVPAVIMTGDMGLTEAPADLAKCALLHKPVDVDKFFSVIGRLAA